MLLIGDALSQRLCQLLPDRAEDCTHAWLSPAHCHAGEGVGPLCVLTTLKGGAFINIWYFDEPEKRRLN